MFQIKLLGAKQIWGTFNFKKYKAAKFLYMFLFCSFRLACKRCVCGVAYFRDDRGIKERHGKCFA